MSGVIESIERAQLRRVPVFQAGDRVRVHFQVVEGTRRRTQVFEGVVIKRQGTGVRETFTVRKQSFGVGVERTFPLHSPKIEQIEVAARGDVRRAKLYYLRERVGRGARVRERRWTGAARRSRRTWRARCRRTTRRGRARRSWPRRRPWLRRRPRRPRLRATALRPRPRRCRGRPPPRRPLPARPLRRRAAGQPRSPPRTSPIRPPDRRACRRRFGRARRGTGRAVLGVGGPPTSPPQGGRHEAEDARAARSSSWSRSWPSRSAWRSASRPSSSSRSASRASRWSRRSRSASACSSTGSPRTSATTSAATCSSSSRPAGADSNTCGVQHSERSACPRPTDGPLGHELHQAGGGSGRRPAQGARRARLHQRPAPEGAVRAAGRRLPDLQPARGDHDPRRATTS